MEIRNRCLSAPYLGRVHKLFDLDDEVFGEEFHMAPSSTRRSRAELLARRRGTPRPRTRGEVRGGGAKPFRQKGTGRARAGSRRAPAWVGGGAAFGP